MKIIYVGGLRSNSYSVRIQYEICALDGKIDLQEPNQSVSKECLLRMQNLTSND